jgi:uncharacterized coiled-coil protein SlyX
MTRCSQTSAGSRNIALGYQAGINVGGGGDNNILVGNDGLLGDNKTIRIGSKPTHQATYIAGISGRTVAGGAGVLIDSHGYLRTNTSVARFKDNIQPMDKASEAILALRPVTFRYKRELDPDGIALFGLVAEEVEKVNPDLVTRDDNGKPYTVRYDAVNAMLLNELLKEYKKVEDQEGTIAQLKLTVAQQQKGFEAKLAKQEEQIEKLTAGLQKVSAQLVASTLAPHAVVTNE